MTYPTSCACTEPTCPRRYARGIRAAGTTEGTSRRTGVLNHIAVHQELRRCRVGSALVSGFVDIAKVHGVERLVLQAEQDNEAAHRLYADLGWKRGAPVRDAEGKTWTPFVLDL
ncbi:GNAT family N-acetyltransferase [Nonomuraea sp. NPDC059023]|uniref:GNAT family N-acetyltransferase n=1 Tax=unclassified Nonomuraea TaxID=2593643 RepID=UPI0036C0E0E5